MEPTELKPRKAPLATCGSQLSEVTYGPHAFWRWLVLYPQKIYGERRWSPLVIFLSNLLRIHLNQCVCVFRFIFIMPPNGNIYIYILCIYIYIHIYIYIYIYAVNIYILWIDWFRDFVQNFWIINLRRWSWKICFHISGWVTCVLVS